MGRLSPFVPFSLGLGLKPAVLAESRAILRVEVNADSSEPRASLFLGVRWGIVRHLRCRIRFSQSRRPKPVLVPRT